MCPSFLTLAGSEPLTSARDYVCAWWWWQHQCKTLRPLPIRKAWPLPDPARINFRHTAVFSWKDVHLSSKCQGVPDKNLLWMLEFTVICTSSKYLNRLENEASREECMNVEQNTFNPRLGFLNLKNFWWSYQLNLVFQTLIFNNQHETAGELFRFDAWVKRLGKEPDYPPIFPGMCLQNLDLFI